jgi:hypothetical protein
MFGNPYTADEFADASEAVYAFSEYVTMQPALIHEIQTKLRGKNLACWCRLDMPCHADVLLTIAND